MMKELGTSESIKRQYSQKISKQKKTPEPFLMQTIFGGKTLSRLLIGTHSIHFPSHTDTGRKLNSGRWVMTQDYPF